MWNQEIYLKTLLFAGEAHIGQKVPGTEISYVVHITNVCMEAITAIVNSPNHQLDTDLIIQGALLHDTIEDTKVTYNDLLKHFGHKVAKGVLALSKNQNLPTKQEQMQDSLTRIIEQGPEIRVIKMADRIQNLQAPPHYWTLEKKKAYLEEAKILLNRLKGINHFIENRLAQKIAFYPSYF